MSDDEGKNEGGNEGRPAAEAEVVMSTLGIRVPDELRAKIREAARLEGRTESSFARFYLVKAADAVIEEHATEAVA